MTSATNSPTIDLDKVFLLKGRHSPVESREQGHYCMLELVSVLAGEPQNDHPDCVSPVIAGFCRMWNDYLNDQNRQLLKPYVPRLIGSVGTPSQEVRRAYMVADWTVRIVASTALRQWGFNEHAMELRTIPPVINVRTARLAARLASAVGEIATVYPAYWVARAASNCAKVAADAGEDIYHGDTVINLRLAQAVEAVGHASEAFAYAAQKDLHVDALDLLNRMLRLTAK